MIQVARAACLLVFVAFGCSDESPKPAAPPKAGSITLRNDGVGLVKTTNANGKSIKLDHQFENAVIARKNADGTLEVECHDDQPQAEAFMKTASTASAPELQ